HPHDVAPLPVGGFTAETVPAQLLQHNVLGRIDEKLFFRAGTHANPAAPIQLARVEGAVRDEEVHFNAGGLMNGVDARAGADGAPGVLGLEIEIVAQTRRQLDDTVFRKLDNEIDIQSGAGLTREGAGQRTANEITQPGSLKCGGDREGDAQDLGHRARGSKDSSSGYALRASSGPRVRCIRRRKHSRSVASGWRWRMSARASARTVSRIWPTNSSFSAGVMRRQISNWRRWISGAVSRERRPTARL